MQCGGPTKRLASGNVQAMMDLFADDAVIHVGGRSKLAGDYKGKDQLLEMYGRFMQSLGNIEEMSTHDILANDTHGIQLQTVKAERDGRADHDQVLRSDALHGRQGHRGVVHRRGPVHCRSVVRRGPEVADQLDTSRRSSAIWIALCAAS